MVDLYGENIDRLGFQFLFLKHFKTWLDNKYRNEITSNHFFAFLEFFIKMKITSSKTNLFGQTNNVIAFTFVQKIGYF